MPRVGAGTAAAVSQRLKSNRNKVNTYIELAISRKCLFVTRYKVVVNRC
jgi:hypothetical protein